MSSVDVSHSLRGKIITTPVTKKWSLTKNPKVVKCAQVLFEDTADTYAYTYEEPSEWTPYNSNLHMQGIKVYVKEPGNKKADAIANSLFLIDIMRENRKKEMEAEKAQHIRMLAMEKKKQMNMKN
eukprot:GFUD01039972.1.p1 GENE.GFUD01039972.1~~GFUD01039972.1.p1  ORF type:complete len:125 (+),score=21.55 GFUD01039972.1:24-398(+)